MDRIKEEKKLVGKMIKIYCRHQHGNRFFLVGTKPRNGLCPTCGALYAYAQKRLDKCKYGVAKTVCAECKTHCYQPEMREKIRETMRYAGPRLIFYRPIDAIRYLIRKRGRIRENE